MPKMWEKKSEEWIYDKENNDSVYDIIPRNKRLVGKAHTYIVERMNHILRRYLAHFSRKTYFWSKSLNVIINSTFLFLYRYFFLSIHF